MNDIQMPPAFPEEDFRAFAIAASAASPPFGSYQASTDPLEKLRQSQWSWQAVRYRYRTCAECNEEFKTLLAGASDSWKAGWGDEELTYKLERCIYQFFTSALSVFDSFAFCLYFYGHALEPNVFPDVVNPRNITRSTTTKAFRVAFPHASITGLLAGLPSDMRFSTIDVVRNTVGHRLSGRRSVRAFSTTEPDGTHTHWREETWHLPGREEQLMFDEQLLQRHLNDATDLLVALSAAAREFALAQKAARKPYAEPPQE